MNLGQDISVDIINKGLKWQDFRVTSNDGGFENIESKNLDVFDELKKPNSFVVHGVSGNFDAGIRLKAPSDTWSQIFACGNIVDPLTRKGDWSEHEAKRYNYDNPGDANSVYAYVGNMDVGLGGRSYTCDGFILAPLRGEWADNVVVNSDLDADSRSVTPIVLRRFGEAGEYKSVNIPLSECVVVLSPDMLIEQIDNLEIFCTNHNLDFNDWIKSHIIVADITNTEDEAILAEAITRCHQDGDLKPIETELTHNAKAESTQQSKEVVFGAKVITQNNCSTNFIDPKGVDIPDLIKRKTEDCVRLAKAGYYSVTNLGFDERSNEIMRLIKTAKATGIGDEWFVEQLELQQYFNDSKLVRWQQDGWIDAESSLNNLYPHANSGDRRKLGGAWYVKTKEVWVVDKTPTYEDY